MCYTIYLKQYVVLLFFYNPITIFRTVRHFKASLLFLFFDELVKSARIWQNEGLLETFHLIPNLHFIKIVIYLLYFSSIHS